MTQISLIQSFMPDDLVCRFYSIDSLHYLEHLTMLLFLLPERFGHSHVVSLMRGFAWPSYVPAETMPLSRNNSSNLNVKWLTPSECLHARCMRECMIGWLCTARIYYVRRKSNYMHSRPFDRVELRAIEKTNLTDKKSRNSSLLSKKSS